MKFILKSSLFAILATIIFTSCNSTSAVDLTDETEVQNLQEVVNKYLPENSIVYTIQFNSNNNEANNIMRAIKLVYSEKDGEYKNIFIPLGEGKVQTNKETEPFGSFQTTIDSLPKGRSVKDMDYTIITKNINKGIELFKNENITFSGIESYKIYLYQNTDKDIHKLALLSSDGKTIRQYGIYPIVIDQNGNPIPDEEPHKIGHK